MADKSQLEHFERTLKLAERDRDPVAIQWLKDEISTLQ